MSLRQIKVNGRKVWQARIAFKHLRKSAIRESREEARQLEGQLLRDLQERVRSAESDAAAPATLRALLDAYAEDLVDRGKGDESVGRVEYTARAIEALMPELLERPVTTIGDAEIFAFRKVRKQASLPARELRERATRLRGAGDPAGADLLDSRALALDREGTKPSTINRDLRTLRAALKKARPDYRFPGGAFFKEDEARVRWLRPEEELLVLETMATPFREIAKLAALTLMRLTEIRSLRREYVHMEQGVVLLPQAKAGARPVILSEAARKIVGAQLEAHPKSELVFPGPGGRPYSREQIGKVFRRHARAAGLKDFLFHDLRHHGATMALNKGFTAPIVMALGGWKTERMMRRYAAVTDATLRAAAEAVSGTETTAAWQRGVATTA
jgi:integrase